MTPFLIKPTAHGEEVKKQINACPGTITLSDQQLIQQSGKSKVHQGQRSWVSQE